MPTNLLGRPEAPNDPRLRGFSIPEAAGRWTDARRAAFSCRFTIIPKKPIRISVDADAFLPPGVSRQRVTVRAGHVVKQFVYTQRTPHPLVRLVVPPSDLSRRLTVRLDLPDAISPRAVGFNADSRLIALMVHDIKID
jgi:hypothetical protein